ncbi:MAG: ribulose-phosphate 3-epimerase [Pelolinea sp.]|nr:ribulose-phosphate 3-epimerase [Pelolinea sp.]
MKIKINPSMVCADLSKLGQQVESLNDAGVDLLHWDIMDGVYVHNFCLTPGIMAACRSFSNLPFDVHLCISDPASFITEVAEAGAGIISLQLETTPHLHRAVEQIHHKGIKAGVVINPSTPLSHLESILSEVQMITVMTVDVGFAGQNFIYPMVDKIAALRKIIDDKGMQIDIQVDGQINAKTFSQVINAGANVLVLGASGLFSLSDDIGNAVQVVRGQIDNTVSGSFL